MKQINKATAAWLVLVHWAAQEGAFVGPGARKSVRESESERRGKDIKPLLAPRCLEGEGWAPGPRWTRDTGGLPWHETALAKYVLCAV